MQFAERHADAHVFLTEAMAVFSRIPWVVGGKCEREGQVYRFGDPGAGVARFSHRETALELYTLHAWSASLLLQASLIFRLIVELAEAKKREAALTELRYLRSVHEAGARVTHEVKNMLQSLDNLCFAALAGNENVPDDELRALVGRQLPVLSRRLRQTLERLRDPAREEMARLEPADTWWAALGQRYAHTAVEFEAVTAQGELPVLLFDQVVDNLISNALQKRDVQPGLRVVVSLAQATDGLVLSVQDSGGAIEPTVAARLFLAVMPSDTGLGIGLMQSARLADRLGYRLSLIENRSGCVRFTLARRKVSVVRSVNTQ
jgi:signal transduction histidine kinase